MEEAQADQELFPPEGLTHFFVPTQALTMAISCVSPCTQMTLTVLLFLTVLGSMVGQYKVIVLPECKKVLTGCLSSWT